MEKKDEVKRESKAEVKKEDLEMPKEAETLTNDGPKKTIDEINYEIITTALSGSGLVNVSTRVLTLSLRIPRSRAAPSVPRMPFPNWWPNGRRRSRPWRGTGRQDTDLTGALPSAWTTSTARLPSSRKTSRLLRPM